MTGAARGATAAVLVARLVRGLHSVAVVTSGAAGLCGIMPQADDIACSDSSYAGAKQDMVASHCSSRCMVLAAAVATINHMYRISSLPQ